VIQQYSYRVLKDHTWIWELVSPDGTILRHGFADTHDAARATAMSNWLDVLSGQRGLEEDAVGRVGN